MLLVLLPVRHNGQCLQQYLITMLGTSGGGGG